MAFQKHIALASTLQPPSVALKRTDAVPSTICNSSNTRCRDDRCSLCLEAEGGCVIEVLRGFSGCHSGRAALGQDASPVCDVVGSSWVQGAKHPHFFLQPTLLFQTILDNGSAAEGRLMGYRPYKNSPDAGSISKHLQ